MVKVHPIINPHSVLRLKNGNVDWQKSFPKLDGETREVWLNRLRCLRSAFSYQQSYVNPIKHEERIKKSRDWKKNNVSKCKKWSRDWYNKNRAKVLFNAARLRAKKLKLEFTINLEDIELLIKAGICQATGLKLDISSSRKSALNPSLDRINHSKGYTKDNVLLVCWCFNAAKNTFNIKDFIRVAEAIVKNKSEILNLHNFNQ